MRLNPFKESNLKNLQDETRNFLSYYLSPALSFIKSKWNSLHRNGKERITVMIVPHTEQKIINFHLSIYAIMIIILTLLLGLAFTSVAIINHSYTSKDISKLKKYGTDSIVQIDEYKKEIYKLYDTFQKLKPELSSVYSLMFQDSSTSLWAKGGEVYHLSNTEMESDSPSIEELNMKELEQELKIADKALDEIKKLIKGKKIIESTPSIRPIYGYILSKSGKYANPGNEYRKGIEIAAYPGDKIRATAPGKVASIIWDRSFGLSVTIKHEYGFSSVFSHCQNAVVKVNQNVLRGETIAFAGKTGNAARHMCFYQIKIGNEFIDPYPYIK